MISKSSVILISTMICLIHVRVTSFSRNCSAINVKTFYSSVQRQRRAGLSVAAASFDVDQKDENFNHKDVKGSKVNITFETSSKSKTILARKGEILRTAMLRRGASPHNGKSRLINCRGLGTCGTCAVEIDCKGMDGLIEPKERNTREKLRLNFPPHGSEEQSPHLRLACQVQVQGDISVRKRTGFWGQDSKGLAEEFEPQLWFGELEYILDDKSPSE